MGKSVGLSIEGSWVRIPPTPLRNLSKFVYPTLPRDASSISVKYGSRSQPNRGFFY